MNQNIEFKAIPGQFNIDEAQGIVECFVAGIGNKDSVGDVLVSGAFTKSLTRRKPRVVWGHNWNDPIGKVIEIYEVAPGDRRLPMKMLNAGIGGLYARVQFNLNSEKGREAFANVAFFGQEQEWSIGYKTLDSIFDPNIQANILKEVELYEVSPVLHGANQLTGTISVKSDEQFDDAKGGMMVVGMGGPMAGKPTGMMPNRRPTPNILEANKPKIGDERKNQLEIELSLRAGAPVKVRVAEENSVIFDRLTPDGAPTTYKVSYHFTGKEFMFGKPEKVSVQTVYVPSSEESGSRVIIPSQMPSMPMQVKPQRDAYMGDSHDEYHSMMPKSYDDGEKWAFDDDIADLANIISDSLDIKVGRALSSKNMSKLKAILENLQDVIASAEKDVESKSDYVIPVAIENAFETKQLLDPIFDYHRVESHVTEDGIIVTSGVTQEFVEAIGVAEKALGQRLGGGLGKLGRAARGAANFDPKAWDGDGDGLVQEGTPYQRPAIPGVNDRSTGGRVDLSAATRAFRQDGKPGSSDSEKPSSRREGLASRGKPDPISREGEFHGGNIYDEFNGQYVEGEVIALSDLYGDDRPGYAVVGRYDSDGTGTVDYFYGGDDEEFETIEDAVAFLQNIENEGENDRFYNDDNFRSLDRARSAGRPGKRPLAGLASSSSASWQLPNSEKDKDGITVLDSQVLKDRTAGLSLDEAAKKFGIPKEKIRKMEAREMQRIREEMNPKDFVAYRMMGMSLEDLSKITGKTRAELRQIEAKEIARMKKNPSNEELLEYRERGMSLENLSKISGLKREEIRKREITAWNGKPQIPEPDKRMSDYDIRKMQEGMIDGLASTNPNVRPNAGVIKYSNDLLNEKLEDLDSDPQPGMAGAMLDRAWAEGVIEGLRDGRLSSEDAINIIGLAGSDVFNEGKKPEGQRDQGLIDSRIKLSKRLRKSVVDSMSEGDMEEYQANRRRRGGFASTSDRRMRDENNADEYDEAFGPTSRGSRRGMADDPVGDAASENLDRDRNAQAVRRGLASTSETIDDEIKGGTILPEHESVIKDIFDEIETDTFKSDDGGEIVGKARIKFLKAIEDGSLGDDPEKIDDYKNLFMELLYDNMVKAMNPMFYKNPGKERRRIEESVGKLVDEFMKSFDSSSRFLPKKNLIVTEKNVKLDKKKAKETLAELFEAIDEDTLPMSARDFFSKFESVFEDDPTLDIEKTLKDIENAITSAYDGDDSNEGLRELIEDYGFDGSKHTDKSMIEELESIAIDSDNYEPNIKASEIINDALEYSNAKIGTRGGFASNRSEGTMLGRDGQISRDERGNVDPTEIREARAAFDQNVFKKLRELGFDDEEIEKLTGVPDGGRVGEGGKPAQYVPDNLGRGGLASESRAPGKFSNNTALQRITRAVSESGTTVLDSEILKDFLSGMSAEEINSKHKLGGASNANSAANREIRRIRANIDSQANSDMDLLIYRTSGLSLRETAELFNISPKEVRKREIRLQLKLRKEIDDEDLLYLRSGLTLEQTGRVLMLDPSDVRKKEQKIINNNRKKIKDIETAADKQRETDNSALEINEELSEMDAGPRYQEISKRLGISVDEVKESIGRAKDRKERTSRATEGRTGLSSESREMDMTLAEYAKIDEVLSKYMDDSQLSGIGADEDMQVIQNILDKIDDSSAANDAIVMSDSEIDEYIDTLTRMKNNGPVEDQSDKEEIEKLIDSLNKTKKSATGSYSSEALEDAGTRLSSPSGAASEGEKNRPVKKVRAFRTLNGTINPHKKLEIELTENEIGALREEVDLLSRTAENPNILRAVGEKLRKANKGKFSITSDEYEDIVKSIEQSKSKGRIPSSDILGVLEQASETSDGKFSSLNLRGGGLASSNGGKRPNNGAPPDITEAMQKELIFWGKSSRGYNLTLVQEAIKEYDANDGQLPPAMWKRLQTMYKNMGPGSASGGARRGMTGRNNGSGRRARTGLASSGGEESMGRDRGPGVSVSGLGDVGMRADSQGSFGVGRGGADMSSGGGGTNQEKFEGVSFDDAKPGNWGELTNEEKFEWLMYEGNPEKVADKDQRMSRAAHEGAVKKVLTDMEREERRSMSPAERRAAKESERSETSERELERQRVAREKREKDKAQEKTPKEYKPAPNAEEGKKKRAVDFDSFKEWIEDTEIMLGDIDEGQDYDPIAQDIWKTVDALLGDQDMTKRSIDDTIDALEDYLEGASSDNKYEKKSISRAKKLLSELSKAKTKYENDPWIVDDRIRTGLASRSGGPNRPRPGSREMPQSNAKRDNEMKKIIDTAQRVIDEMKSQKDSNKGRRARVGLASSSRPKAMITDEATFFKDIETSLQKEIRAAQKAKNKKAENGLSKLQEVIRRNEASKTGSRRTNVGSIYLTDDEADLVLDGLMFALDNQIEIGGDKRIEWYTKLLEKVSQAAMSTFINKNV